MLYSGILRGITLNPNKCIGMNANKILNRNTIDHTLQHGESDVLLIKTLGVC